MRARFAALVLSMALGQAASAQVYSNPAPITIPSQGQASVYPSTINVSGMGQVTSVAVVFNNMTHTFAGDLDILLVGPNGVGVYILSDAGTGGDFNGGYYGFAIGGETFTTGGAIAFPSRIYAPTFTTGDETFPGAVYTYGASLAAFNGANANGDWKLYIIDDASGDFGEIAEGWSLVFNSQVPGNTGNTFTYQGKLEGASGPVDLRFLLCSTKWFPVALSAADWQFGIGNVMPDENGLFTVQIPFTPGFMDGGRRFLEVAASPAGQNDYTTLTPRQELTVAPLAEWANRAGTVSWDGVSGVPNGLADGVDDTGPWTVTSDGVQYAGGQNVGVGATMTHAFNVTSPTMYNTRLHSTATVGTALEVTNSNTPQSGLFMISNAPGTGGIGNLVIRNVNAAYTYPGLILTPANYLGINTISPDFTLTVNGTAGKPGGGSWAVWSDARLKHDITPLAGTLDKLLNVHGVSYFYNEPEKIGERAGRQTGVVAQEVEKVFPEWVDEGPSGYKSVTFRGFEAMTIEALRDLRNEKDAQIKTLREENAELRARLERLEKAVGGE